MYGFINSRGEHAALEAGYLVKKAGTEMPYNRNMDDIIMAINKHCPNMDKSDYIMLGGSFNFVDAIAIKFATTF